jgi:hypothetical protein
MEFINTLMFLWIALTSCMGQTKSITFENYYAPNEILELKKIIQFIDKEIIKECNESRLDCYNDFFNQFKI